MESNKIKRVYSESFKRAKVNEIIKGKTTISHLSALLGLSYTSVYKWVKKYGNLRSPEKIVIETDSDYLKLIESNKKNVEMERLIGQQQLQLSFLKEVLKEVELHYGEDPIEKFLKK
jgi:transposase-like protein